jgi:hypothetical protein
MPKFDPFTENRVQEALRILERDPTAKVSTLARRLRIPPDQLYRRRKGVPPPTAKGGLNKKLTPSQERVLKGYISFLIYTGIGVETKHIERAANSILRADNCLTVVSSRWPVRWLERNTEWIKSIRSKTIHAERKAAHVQEEIERHFNAFQETVERYGINAYDSWNMDETGFTIGVLGNRVVLTFKGTQAVYLADPDERELITLVECCSGSGHTIDPMVIIKGRVHLEKYFTAKDMAERTLFGVSESGYTNSFLTLEWLKHFNNETKEKRLGNWRMLIFDGHGAHLSQEFIDYCWDSQIVPFQLPSHTTHLTQPLDVGVFAPYKHWHQKAIADSCQFGDFRFDKVEFLHHLQGVRNKTFKPSTIRSAFQKAGLIPFDPKVVLSKMRVFEPPIPEPLKTPPQAAVPFQSTPTSHTFKTHSTYINTRIEDHIQHNVPLTPRFWSSRAKLESFLEERATENTLVKEREIARSNHEKAKNARKNLSQKVVQRGGVIYHYKAVKDIEDRITCDQEVVNMREKRQDQLYRKKYLTVMAQIRGKVRRKELSQYLTKPSFFEEIIAPELELNRICSVVYNGSE